MIYNQMVTWTAFAILAMFSKSSGEKIGRRQELCGSRMGWNGRGASSLKTRSGRFLREERGSGREKFCSWSPQILCLEKLYAGAIIFSSALRASEARHDQAEMKYRSDCYPPLNVVLRI